MILFANFLRASASIVRIILNIYVFIVIIRVVLSWFMVPSLRPLAVIVYHFTEPVLRPLRRLIPPNKMGGIDITPIIVIFIIIFINRFIVETLLIYARQLLGGQGFNF